MGEAEARVMRWRRGWGGGVGEAEARVMRRRGSDEGVGGGGAGGVEARVRRREKRGLWTEAWVGQRRMGYAKAWRSKVLSLFVQGKRILSHK